jgi:hypothetical protein
MHPRMHMCVAYKLSVLQVSAVAVADRFHRIERSIRILT